MYRLKDIMEMFQIPERTIRRHIKLGILKGKKAGGTWRFDEEDLREYLSHPVIQSNQSKTKYREIMDFMNGFVKTDEEVVVITQLKQANIHKNKEISLLMNTFRSPLYFNLEKSGGKTIVTFKGNKEDAIKLIQGIDQL